ncbi:MAG TPA: hypothetical protein VGB73_03880 [Pyrinomonadaceae bacterium]|jgi:hypothetical protein
MRKAFSLLILCLLASASPSRLLAAVADARTQDPPPVAQAQPAAPLTNQDVLDMLKAGLSQEVVVAKIKSTSASFDTSPAVLQELKAAGVPEAVILAMVQAPSVTAASAIVNLAASVEMKVPDGTAVEIELKQSVSAKSLKEGDIVDFTVLHPVQVGGVTVIEKGAPAKARITKAKKAGYWGRAGKLEWAMQDVLSIDGGHVPLRFTQRTTGDSKGGTVTTGAVVTGIIFPPAALLWGLKKGKDATVPAGQRYNVFVHGDAVVRGVPATQASTPSASN